MPHVPPAHAQLTRVRSSDLTIHYACGRQRMTFEVRMQVDLNGNLEFRHPNGGGLL
jgi:hypothetical protein